MAYRDEVQRLVERSTKNNLSLNPSKTKELYMDFSRNKPAPAPLYINGVCVQRVSHFKFLGAHISEDLSWSVNTTAAVKKAQQRLHFLRVLKRNNLEEKLLVTFYRSTIESVLVYAVTVWYAGTTAADKARLQRVIRSAERITGCPLPPLDELASSRCLSRAKRIVEDHYHPGHHLFRLLPSGRRYQVTKCRTNRLKNSFYPWAIRTLNGRH